MSQLTMRNSVARLCLAQTPYTDPKTGIQFSTWTEDSGYTYGFALPGDALTKDSTEYIGILVSMTIVGAIYRLTKQRGVPRAGVVSVMENLVR